MARLSLVIVDDETDILHALKRMFRKEFEIRTFDSGSGCLEFLTHNKADIVLSDIRMPYMDGFTLMAELKTHHPDLTRICMSGYADTERCQTAIQEGLFEYLIPKPWDNFEFQSIINLFAENRLLKQQIATLTNGGT